MTVDQLLRECQKLKLQGYGDFTVMITDLTDEPPVPEPIGSITVRKYVEKVFIQSQTLDEIVATVNKRKQELAKDSKS